MSHIAHNTRHIVNSCKTVRHGGKDKSTLHIIMHRMTTENIEVILTKRYGIAEIAKLLGIPKRRIYYHVKKGWLKTERRDIDHKMVAYGSDVYSYWHSFQ